MENQDMMQAAYHVEYPIKKIFDQIKTVQEFAITGNYPFSDRHQAKMGITQILGKQEYTHAYRMWKRIATNERTRVLFKAYFQYVYLYWEELEETAGATGYVSINNIKHRKIEDAFMTFASMTAAPYAAFT